jgi:hypothetical protein
MRRRGEGGRDDLPLPAIVRNVRPDDTLTASLRTLKRALNGRVLMRAAGGLSVEVADLAAVSSINRRVRRGESLDRTALGKVLAREKPSVRARVDAESPLHVAEGALCLRLLVDADVVLGRPVCAALKSSGEDPPTLSDRALAPLAGVGHLVLGEVVPNIDSSDQPLSMYRDLERGFPSAADLVAFCEDPNGYLESQGLAKITYPESVSFGPMYLQDRPRYATAAAVPRADLIGLYMRGFAPGIPGMAG